MRIASLVPSATELLFALDLGDSVVAVTHAAPSDLARPLDPRRGAGRRAPPGRGRRGRGGRRAAGGGGRRADRGGGAGGRRSAAPPGGGTRVARPRLPPG